MWDYSDKVKDHFLHPRNARVIEDANAVGDVGSIICGDALRLMLKVDPDTHVIEDAAFQTYGCGSAIASSSALTEMIRGKTLEEASKITNQQIADYLDGLPPEKMHCSVMGREALDAAIANFRGQSYAQSHDDGELICHCFGVGINKIKKAIWENHLTTVEEVTNFTKAGGGCGSCRQRIEEIIDEVWEDLEKCGTVRPGTRPEPIPGLRIAVSTGDEPAHVVEQGKAAPAPQVSDGDRIRRALDEIAKGLRANGSDLALTAVGDSEIHVRLSGPAASGMMKDMTVVFVTDRLKEHTGKNFKVIAE